jgi:hypothetical protein
MASDTKRQCSSTESLQSKPLEGEGRHSMRDGREYTLNAEIGEETKTK